jgi:predicted CoA-binding protein
VDLVSPAAQEQLLRETRTIAVLGAKPQSRREAAAYWIPEYLCSVGYRIIPIAVKDYGEDMVFGEPVRRSVLEAGRVDVVSVFLKPEAVPNYLDDLLAARPPVVWFQSGLLHPGSAQELVAAGIRVAHSCIGCRRAAMPPALDPLWQASTTTCGK